MDYHFLFPEYELLYLNGGDYPAFSEYKEARELYVMAVTTI